MLLDWRIYYDDGTIFDSEMGTPEQAPAFGIQVIAYRGERSTAWGRQSLVKGPDFYVYDDGEWLGLDMIGLLDWLACKGVVKIGRLLPRLKYEAIVKRAQDDQGFLEE